MSLTTTDASGAYMAVFLISAEMIGSTNAMSRESVVAEDDVKRSFASPSPWSQIPLNRRGSMSTAISEGAPIIVGEARQEDALIAELAEYEGLKAGWDGYDGAQPNATSINAAIRFARAAVGRGFELIPTLHSDGTIILEVDDRGSLRFLSDGRIAYAFDNGRRGIENFSGRVIPAALSDALGA